MHKPAIMNPNTSSGHLADRLRRSGRATRDFFGGLRPRDWQHTVYREGSQWSVRDILAHLVSAEHAMQELLRDIRSGKPTATSDFNIDEFNEGEVERLGQRGAQILLLDFNTARAATVAQAETMSAADLQLHGHHPWFGNVPISKIIKIIYQHNQIHERDVRRALRSRYDPNHLRGAYKMPDAHKADIRAHIDTNHQSFLDVAASLKPADFDIPVYGGRDQHGWRVQSVIAHLAAAASGMLHSARAIAAGEDPVPPNFDLARWNQRSVQKAADVPAELLLDRIEQRHQEWMQFLDEIPSTHLQRRGRHARGDLLTVEGFMRRYAEHEAHHASEIRNALRRLNQVKAPLA